jgi:uncharacterized membrane protein
MPTKDAVADPPESGGTLSSDGTFKLVYGCFLAVVAAPVAFLGALLVSNVYVSGMMDCVDFDAGNRFGAFFEFLFLIGTFWLAFTVPALIGVLAGHVRIAMAIGVIAALSVAHMYLAGVPQASREWAETFAGCRNGVPNWWPWFFPH